MIFSAFAALIVAGAMIASVEEAGAVVCARGVYRAGCAGVRGAAVVRRPVVVAPHRAVVVRPRGAVIVR
ncbi:hypothetical protein SIN04_11935 [Methylocella tundrae]|nr:hypothetical protein [Methylocella tundrae]WPP06428.1 hypothetical protein SIN04_11935 [Methylocella tundrae]